MQKSAYFITFEGGDGVGKSTQLEIINKLSHPFIYCTNPSEVQEAQLIRSLLLSHYHKWELNTEVLLHIAARLEHVQKLIVPTLKANKSIICDRFFDSTIVYQGYAHGADQAFIHKMQNMVVGEIAPDLTFIFDIAPEISLARAKSRSKKSDRYELLDLAFHQKVRQGFLSIAKDNPQRCVIVDATMPIEVIAAFIAKTIKQKLGLVL
jgi:dTMP kinase